MRIAKSKDFWIGVIVGAVVVPMVLNKTGAKVPGVKAAA